MSARGYWVAFTVGLAAGSVVALLYAPQSGAKTRKKLGLAMEDAGDYLEDAGEYLQDQAERLAKESKKLYLKSKDNLEDAYDSASSTLGDAFSSAKGVGEEYAGTAAAYGKKVKSMV